MKSVILNTPFSVNLHNFLDLRVEYYVFKIFMFSNPYTCTRLIIISLTLYLHYYCIYERICHFIRITPLEGTINQIWLSFVVFNFLCTCTSFIFRENYVISLLVSTLFQLLSCFFPENLRFKLLQTMLCFLLCPCRLHYLLYLFLFLSASWVLICNCLASKRFV